MSKDNAGWWSRNANRVMHPEDQSAEQAKRAPWVAVAFLALIAIVAVGVWALRVFWFEPAQSAEPAPVPSSSVPAVDETAPPVPEVECALDSTDRDISTTPPEATQWVVERWAALPVVAGAGPCVERDGYRVGFAKTQTGALLATYHYFVHGIPASPDSGTRGLLEYALLDGPLKDSLLKQVDDVENGVEVRVPDTDYRGVEFGGYRIQSFDGKSAVVEAMLSNATSAGSITVKLVWESGDWRIDPASAEGWGTTQSNVRARDFVPWNSRTGNQS